MRFFISLYIMRLLILIVSVILSPLVFGNDAFIKTDNPLQIESNSLRAEQNGTVLIYEGDVTIQQEQGFYIKADKVLFFLADEKLASFRATGTPVFGRYTTADSSKPDIHFSARNLVYNVDTKRLEGEGEVVCSIGDNYVRAHNMTYTLDDDTLEASGNVTMVAEFQGD